MKLDDVINYIQPYERSNNLSLPKGITDQLYTRLDHG